MLQADRMFMSPAMYRTPSCLGDSQVKIGVISAGEYGHVRLHALQDVLDAPAVIGEIVFLEDAAVGEFPLFLPRQQIDPMAILVQLVNHSVHQRAAAAYQ